MNMTLIIIEAITFFILILAVLSFKVISRPLLGEKEIGPFNIVYLRNMGSTWSTAGVIKKISKYLAGKGIKSNLYICVYLGDPGNSEGKSVPSIIGAVIDDNYFPEVEEPYAITTVASRYVASAANANKIIGFNKSILYPQLRAFMNVNGYTNVTEEYIELYHMEKGNGFGRGFYTEVCTKIRKQTDEEIIATEQYEKRGMDAASMIYGGKGRFGKQI